MLYNSRSSFRRLGAKGSYLTLARWDHLTSEATIYRVMCVMATCTALQYQKGVSAYLYSSLSIYCILALHGSVVSAAWILLSTRNI